MAAADMRVSEAADAVPAVAPTSRLRTLAGGVAGVAVVAVFAKFGLTDRGFVAAFLVGTLCVLAAIDLEKRVVPNRIVLPAFGLVLAAQLALFPEDALEWVLAAAGAALLLLVPALLKPGGLGMGDVKLGLLVGAGLGEDVIRALLVGLLATWPVILYLVSRDGRAAAKLSLPLAPFIAMGTIFALLVD
jgi:leader peptidase (prepilin peptidase) / N-methyltransferase